MAALLCWLFGHKKHYYEDKVKCTRCDYHKYTALMPRGE